VTIGTATVMRAERVSKSFRQDRQMLQAVTDLTLSLEPGEVVAVVGSSGSGKTTLLNLFAGWETPDKGTIVWTADPATSTATLEWSQLAIVPQDVALVDELTVGENILLPATISNRFDDNVRGRGELLMRRLALDELAQRFPRETSVGQQQRASIARALLLTPILLLSDEPTAHQDERSEVSIFSEFRSIAREGSCCVVATHDPTVQRFADRVVAITRGAV